MVAKVGSAGPVVDSVIAYAGNASKIESNKAESNKKEKADTEGKSSRGVNMMAQDRVIKASEIVGDKVHAPKAAESAKAAKAATVKDIIESTDSNENEEIELSREAIEITVDDVNKRLAPTGSSIEFNYHEKTGRYSFKVLDESTGEVIREVPPEKSLDMVAKMFEMVGILVDKKL